MHSEKESTGAFERAAHRSDQPYESLLAIEPDTSASTTPALPTRSRRISQEDVFRSADELLLAGHRPTIDRVRMHLGRGSPNTINDHLDAWWLKLGARLRDLPGREFPQVPERVANALLLLWNTALEGAHESLHGSLREQGAALSEREQTLEERAQNLTAERAELAARDVALNEALEFARDQAMAANRRAETLEGALLEREDELTQLRVRLETLSTESAQLRSSVESERAAAQVERARDREHFESAEARWLKEVDRARQQAKEAEKRIRELQIHLENAVQDRDRRRTENSDLKAQLKTAAAVRQQLEARLQAATAAAHAPTQNPLPERRQRKPSAGGAQHDPPARRSTRLTSRK